MNHHHAVAAASTIILWLVSIPLSIHCFSPSRSHNVVASHRDNHSVSSSPSRSASSLFVAQTAESSSTDSPTGSSDEVQGIFHKFTKFLQSHQAAMISAIEQMDGSGETFSHDAWGAFATIDNDTSTSDRKGSGGITRVIQNGSVIEKGACSLTIIRDGTLTKERAETISARREGMAVGEGDIYSAAALSVVLHTRNPFVPTFRSDVRIFLITSSSKDSNDKSKSIAWFGGGSDLTPYYLNNDEISSFHRHLKSMCDTHFPPNNAHNLSYQQMKHNCDEYFYLPARSEHRGTGGIFFDDLEAAPATFQFVKDVAEGWMPSWLPIVECNKDKEYTDQQKQWQCLRRGRYLEFNLLYDRGVKFGLANANPRVEGVMVSAPPMIAYEYNHVIEKGSEEERLMEVLKKPRDWV